MTIARVTTAFSDRYRIISTLCAGSMATVYLAQDLKLGRNVAIRVLHQEPDSTVRAERFLSGVRTASMLQHPNMLPVHDAGVADGLTYYVSPYVELNLKERLAHEKQLPLGDALHIARQVANALAYVHSKNVIHRDIKPAHILLNGGQAILIHFEYALAVQTGGVRMTRKGIVVGTPPYMSPEQAAGDRNIDGRSDLYSLGCVLYEMLAGEPPFTGATSQSVIEHNVSPNARPLQHMRASVPDAVSAIVATAMATSAADRYPTASAFAAALDSVVSGGATRAPGE